MLAKNKMTGKRLLNKLGAGSVLCGALLMGGVLAEGGCETWDNTAVQHEVSFSIHADRTKLLPGETATIMVDSSNTLGRDPRVEWTTSGGKLTTEEGDGVARVTFPDAGTYLIEAKLFLKGQLVRTDSVTVFVRTMG